MKIRAISDDEKRIPRKIKKRLFGKRGNRTETQRIRYRFEMQYLKHGKYSTEKMK